MPKKDTTSAVVGMLSTAGARTRATEVASDLESGEAVVASPARAPEPEPAVVSRVADAQPSASVSSLPPVRPKKSTGDAPSTVRLSPSAARQLRDAWLEAKRDDVLLTAQDFASLLVEEALHRRRRARSASSR
ncbi:hypothetical protein CIW49_26370 [Mycolicibacterium sp. P1-18]|uniref:hypothetical protein n=1 Tax=Mycolicibacterium sp. P1-18 TaxID=2024615 RepID=UPI0011F300BC|nr:hypothetical protein [Mycolicibacterium sp. P1-18]KAA0093590.1 hypothetical protein CIW49_26370 [Mycolicibacterium sp. P1-18]